jgi:hypothetical protein
MKLVIVALLAALALLMPTTGLNAAPPEPVEGSFQVESLDVLSVRAAGQVCHIDLNAGFSFEGDLDGDFSASFKIVRFGPCDLTVPAPDRFIAHGTYTGSVQGNEGSFDFVFQGGVNDEGIAQGRLVVLQGSDDLSTLRGNIMLSGMAGVGGDYAGQVHFNP